MANPLTKPASSLTFLVTARALTSLGSGITPIALAFGLLQRPGGTATHLSIVFGAQAMAALIVMPFAGVVSDTVGRARLIVASEIAMGLATGLMAMLFLAGRESLPAITCLAVLVGAFAALWWPAYASIVPSVAQHTTLHRANGLLAAATTGGLLLGNLIAGVLVASGGIAIALTIDAITFIAAALIVSRACLRGLESVSTVGSSARDVAFNVPSQLRLGWSQFIRRRWIVQSTLAFGVVVMTWRATKEVLGPAQAVLSPDGAAKWSVVLACQSLGLLAGSLIAAKFQGSGLRMAFAGLCATAAWSLSLALGGHLAIVAAIGILAGASITYFEVTWYSKTQAHVPDRALAHISSMQAASVLAIGPLGLAIAGPLATTTSPSISNGLLACTAVLAISLGMLGTRRLSRPRRK